MTGMEGASTTHNPLALDRQMCFALYAASNLLNRVYAPLLGELGLTYPQYLVMLVLWDDEVQTVGALAARLYLDSGTLSPLLKRMEAADLVSRARDDADERRVLIRLTPAGRALRIRAAHVPGAISGDDPPAGLDDLRERVRRLVDLLAERCASTRRGGRTEENIR